MLENIPQQKQSSLESLKGPEVIRERLPVIYSPGYNVGLADLQQWHPLDFRKREKIFTLLCEKLDVDEALFITPEPAEINDLLAVHSIDYLMQLEDPACIAEIFMNPELARYPVEILKEYLLEPMRLATGGTLRGVELAVECGWAINLSGGFHHASPAKGEGFCFYSDVALAAKKAARLFPGGDILIVDLDAHQGNGTAHSLVGEERVVLMDVYNRDIYPRDAEARRRVDYDLPVSSHTTDAEYLPLIKNNLEKILSERDIKFIIFNAGADVAGSDWLGRLDISNEGVAARDSYIFGLARDHKIPCLMVLSGAYGPHAAELISESLSAIIESTDHYRYLSQLNK